VPVPCIPGCSGVLGQGGWYMVLGRGPKRRKGV